MSNPLAIRHLLIRLRPVNRALRAAVERQAAIAAQLDRPDLVPYCITDEQVAGLLDRLDALPLPDGAGVASLTPEEHAAEQQVRDEASAAGVALPLDELAGWLGLTEGEQQALLLCAAPELDRAYERVIAYVLDDLNRRFPCVELLTMITPGSGLGGLTERGVLSRTGQLRLLGLLTACGEAPTDLRQELRVPSGVVDFLLGRGGDLAVLAHDPGAVPIPDTAAIPPQLDAAHLNRLGKAMRTGELDLVGVWGSPRAGQQEAVYALAGAAGMPLRQAVGADIKDALNIAAALGAILWLGTDDVELPSATAGLLTRSRTPVCLSGTEPWRPAAVLPVRAYAEIVIASPSYRDRVAMWAQALPELDTDSAEDLAARYRMSDQELRAIAALARTEALPEDPPCGPSAVCGDGALDGAVTRAVAAVTCGPSVGFARAIMPRRRPEDLVLPPVEHQMVLELAAACRAWPRVAQDWGFAAHGNPGVKALFTGEPGTGKTLAAEVIAGMLGLTLLKVDLSQVVSKWVGETEKNLDTAFRQAENSQALLFFDEADALFGQRGEIRHGIDRYANLEVGFLLQRLEQSEALVILASNLKENLDKAFTRRFHYIIHFPRPQIPERERMWHLAFPSEAPLAADADLSAIAQLDMTGASISGAARTAALLAADAGTHVITTAHVVWGIQRQYDREARLLRPEELGAYADMIGGSLHA
jgi:ATPase family associated with various cellular activities (AAA)/Winged helix domain, variant